MPDSATTCERDFPILNRIWMQAIDMKKFIGLDYMYTEES